MTMKTVYLVIRADETTRTLTWLTSLRADEIAIPLRLVFPNAWGRVLADRTIELAVPDFTPEVAAEIGGSDDASA